MTAHQLWLFGVSDGLGDILDDFGPKIAKNSRFSMIFEILTPKEQYTRGLFRPPNGNPR